MHQLIDKYRKLHLGARAGVAFVIGVGLMWFNSLEANYASMSKRYEEKKSEVETMKDKVKSLSSDDLSKEDIEASIKSMQQEYDSIKKSLPPRFVLDEIILFVAKSASESGVTLKSFEPQEKNEVGGDFVYYKLPISMGVEGTYKQIGTFFSKLSQMEMMVNIRDVSFKKKIEVPKERAARSNADKKEEDHLIVKLTKSLATYRVDVTSVMDVFSLDGT